MILRLATVLPAAMQKGAGAGDSENHVITSAMYHSICPAAAFTGRHGDMVALPTTAPKSIKIDLSLK